MKPILLQEQPHLEVVVEERVHLRLRHLEGRAQTPVREGVMLHSDEQRAAPGGEEQREDLCIAPPLAGIHCHEPSAVEGRVKGHQGCSLVRTEVEEIALEEQHRRRQRPIPLHAEHHRVRTVVLGAQTGRQHDRHGLAGGTVRGCKFTDRCLYTLHADDAVALAGQECHVHRLPTKRQQHTWAHPLEARRGGGQFTQETLQQRVYGLEVPTGLARAPPLLPRLEVRRFRLALLSVHGQSYPGPKCSSHGGGCRGTTASAARPWRPKLKGRQRGTVRPAVPPEGAKPRWQHGPAAGPQHSYSTHSPQSPPVCP
mmetsp:Transcript_64635/g.179243  ORF Transcript_64635/g.179243 Transcript_64635/m.179243 type:complete len:312 (-) Transcript_64635:10-945(-)